MASRGNIPWSPIKRYINRMQHLQSHLFYPLSFQRIPFYFIPSFNSPYNSFIHPITINSLYPSPLYMHNFIFVLRKRYLFKRKNTFSNFPNDRNQNKFHPGSRSTADYNRLFPPGVGEEEARPLEKGDISACAPPLNFQPTEVEGGRKEIPWPERARHRQRSFVRSLVASRRGIHR